MGTRKISKRKRKESIPFTPTSDNKMNIKSRIFLYNLFREECIAYFGRKYTDQTPKLVQLPNNLVSKEIEIIRGVDMIVNKVEHLDLYVLTRYPIDCGFK